MKKIISKTARSVTILIIFSTLLALSGMAVIVSADEEMPVINLFHGNVAVDGEYVESGTITTYINGESSGSSEIVNGHYYISVEGGTSDAVITFEINGEPTDQTVTWKASTQSQELNLHIGDQPAGDPPAQPSTGDNTPNGGGTSGGYVSPAATPTGTDAQPASWENVTSAPSVAQAESTTPAETSTKKLAEKPETKGLLPGFEAVFAIAGLLAVAYLIRRR
jgi:PGF-CTERM protein